ncbi:MAG: helix-turn-helix domain-containing protein [bacterium]
MHWFKLFCNNTYVRNNGELSFKHIAYRKKRGGIVRSKKGAEHYSFIFFYNELYIGNPGDFSLHKPHTFIIYSPGQPRYYGKKTGKWSHSWFSFYGDYAEKILKDLNFTFNKAISLKNEITIEKYIIQIQQEVFETPEVNLTILKNIFSNLLIELKREIHYQNKQNTTIPENILTVKKYIDLHYSENLTLDFLSVYANISKPYLIKQFKEYYSITPIEYVIFLRLEEAKRLLLDNNMSIKDIAQEVGYKDIYYFSRQFKERFKQSPSMYRKK